VDQTVLGRKQDRETLRLTSLDPVFPSTRFQGSKSKIVGWIWESIRSLQFHSALDVFGGTGCVSHKLKQNGKAVTYNDVLQWNSLVGKALIENDRVRLSRDDVDLVLTTPNLSEEQGFIASTFQEIYYTEEENRWLDRIVPNLNLLDDPYKRALAFFALFQACIIKRPYNLFHRKNLYVRLSNVKRSFGNKRSWDTPFEVHFRKFVEEANAAVFGNGERNRSISFDALEVPGFFDLVYVDSPYISGNGVGVDYHEFYHFLEGLTRYTDWHGLVDWRSKHRRMLRRKSPWTDKAEIAAAFDSLFAKYRDSKLVVSYRSDGIPSVEDLAAMLRKYKSNVEVLTNGEYQYVLSTKRCQEVLLIGT